VRSDDSWIPAEINPIICNISESEFDELSNELSPIFGDGRAGQAAAVAG
jgi:hypothetical protein